MHSHHHFSLELQHTGKCGGAVSCYSLPKHEQIGQWLISIFYYPLTNSARLITSNQQGEENDWLPGLEDKKSVRTKRTSCFSSGFLDGKWVRGRTTKVRIQMENRSYCLCLVLQYGLQSSCNISITLWGFNLQTGDCSSYTNEENSSQ